MEHQGWNVAHIGDGSKADHAALRLRRTGHLLVRLGQRHGTSVVTVPAIFILGLGLMLQDIADDRERGR
ncbi:MAG: hypothetical protein IVW52_12545 [Acidimicrobiales bacterium]|nr:hypothetical protein [Acidimicrobiales bacterium]